MSKTCEICGRGPKFGQTRSESERKSHRRWNPNLQKIRVKQGDNVKRMWVCTRCIKSGKVQKP